jgi:hypothetical protein
MLVDSLVAVHSAAVELLIVAKETIVGAQISPEEL